MYIKSVQCTLGNMKIIKSVQIIVPPPQLVREPHLPLSHLISSVECYQMLLPSLEEAVKHIMHEGLRGGQILSYLHNCCSSGFPDIQKAYEKCVEVVFIIIIVY